MNNYREAEARVEVVPERRSTVQQCVIWYHLNLTSRLDRYNGIRGGNWQIQIDVSPN
jgi:hypothetical protein